MAMAVSVAPTLRHRGPALSPQLRRVSRAQLLGVLVGVVVLAAGCGTAAGSDGSAVAKAAGASAAASAPNRLPPVCACGPTAAAAALASAHVGDLDVSSGYAVTSVRSSRGSTTTAYMAIANDGLHLAGLVAASSPEATSVQLEHTTKNGSTAVTTAVDSIPVPVAGMVTLAPGGYQVTVTGLSTPLRIGDRLSLTLHFSGGRTAHLTLPVESR